MKKDTCKIVCIACYLLCQKEGKNKTKHKHKCLFLQNEIQEGQAKKQRGWLPITGGVWRIGYGRERHFLENFFCIALTFGSMLTFYILRDKNKLLRTESTFKSTNSTIFQVNTIAALKTEKNMNPSSI